MAGNRLARTDVVDEVPCCLCDATKPDSDMFECLGQFICDGHTAEEVQEWISYKLGGKK